MKNIHLNVKLEKKDTGYIATTTVRLWSYIPSSLSWLMGLPYPASADIVCGRSILLLTNLALMIEGFLVDVLISHIENNTEQKMKALLEKINAGKLRWKDLIKKYKEYLGKDLNDISCFESIEMLFILRNNIAHGKTYSESSVSQDDMQREFTIFSSDQKYNKVRQYLIGKNVIKYELVTGNKPEILNSNVPTFFYFEVREFLFTLIDSINFANKENIKSELTNSFVDCI